MKKKATEFQGGAMRTNTECRKTVHTVPAAEVCR